MIVVEVVDEVGRAVDVEVGDEPEVVDVDVDGSASVRTPS
jgi:hypothetical protein